MLKRTARLLILVMSLLVIAPFYLRNTSAAVTVTQSPGNVVAGGFAYIASRDDYIANGVQLQCTGPYNTCCVEYSWYNNGVYEGSIWDTTMPNYLTSEGKQMNNAGTGTVSLQYYQAVDGFSSSGHPNACSSGPASETASFSFKVVASNSTSVGGVLVPVDKLALIAPFIALAALVVAVASIIVVNVRHTKHGKEKPRNMRRASSQQSTVVPNGGGASII